jgi:Icc-related predicted phosphoesterase
MTKICCLSDLHGDFPRIPDCDLLLLSGDYCPWKEDHWWYRENLVPWIEETAARGITIVGIAGNHDYAFCPKPTLIPKMPWHYLDDSGVTVHGLKIWGTPWQPIYADWAFNAEEEVLEKKWELIPPDTDILLVHAPPRGYGDLSLKGNVKTGSPSLTARIEKIQPKLVVCGHIHEGYGQYQLGNTLIINAAQMDWMRKPTNPVVRIEL